jgi:hypothetical protein
VLIQALFHVLIKQYMMVGWFLATERAEADAAKREKLVINYIDATFNLLLYIDISMCMFLGV